MRINIVHHHLHPGGVTRVIESQTRALQHYYPGLQLRLILGHLDNPEPWEESGIEVIINEQLNYLYDSESLHRDHVVKLSSDIRGFFHTITKPGEDFLHIHNLNLGKNPAMTYAIYQLAQQGYLVLNHAHDFSEDRPANQKYMQKIIADFLGAGLQEVMYPNLSNYRFGVLNAFDYQRLQNYGVEQERISLLENPVAFGAVEAELPDYEQSRQNIVATLGLNPAKNLITYPVRVIRRKNIGEFILLAVLFADTAEWLVTQPPKNPQEYQAYQEWTEFCNTHGIRIHFEAGTKVDFEELLVASDFCITTSRQEGFGMVYLEPWLMNTPIIGRDLEHITRDMKDKGIVFPAMYNRLLVDMQGKEVDFKDAEVKNQRVVIEKALNDTTYKKQIIARNKFLEVMFEDVSSSLIKTNQAIIYKEYSYQQYAKKLYEIYQAST